MRGYVENFKYMIRPVENGWVVVDQSDIRDCAKEYVFSSLGDVGDWLKGQAPKYEAAQIDRSCTLANG